MYLNQKDLKEVMTIANVAGRINELERIEPYVSSGLIQKRKAELKRQLRKLIGEKENIEEQVVKIEIKTNLPEEKKEEKKKNSLTFNLKDLFKGAKLEEEEPVVRVLRGLFPEEEVVSIGKIIREL